MSPVSFRTTLGTATGILSSTFSALTFRSSIVAAVQTPLIRASKSTKPGSPSTSFVRCASYKLGFTPPEAQVWSCIDFLPLWKLARSSSYRPSISAQALTHELFISKSRRHLQFPKYYSTSSPPDIAPDTSSKMNGEARPKRKHSPVSASDRPAKHLKPESTILTPGDETPANGTVYDVENGEDITPIVAMGAAQADSPEWQATIESVVKSVVSIHFCQTCSFDTDLSMCSQATGFVVDAQRGYILTNRHVVCAGPFGGYCIFDNHEEVSRRF